MTRVVLSQPLPRVTSLAKRLQLRGHETAIFATRELLSRAARPEISTLLASIADRDWVVFVSPGAIDMAFDAFEAMEFHWPTRTAVALIGPGSEQALRDRLGDSGDIRLVRPQQPPYDADALMRLPPFTQPAGMRILVLAGERGRTDWIDDLRARGAIVQRAVIYGTLAIEPELERYEALARWAESEPAPVFSFTSVDAASELDAGLRDHGLSHWAHRRLALAPHPRIVKRLVELGWEQVQLVEPGERALLAAIESS